MADIARLNDQLVMDSKQDLVDEIVRLRAALEAIRQAKMPGEARCIAIRALDKGMETET